MSGNKLIIQKFKKTTEIQYFLLGVQDVRELPASYPLRQKK
jgi:hypothetical protein